MHVGIVMGSDSDLPVMKKAAEVLSGFGVTYDMAIASAHRTPKKLEEFILAKEEKGAACFIAGAGMAAAQDCCQTNVRHPSQVFHLSYNDKSVIRRR